jgi:type I restriction enzyme S subunit
LQKKGLIQRIFLQEKKPLDKLGQHITQKSMRNKCNSTNVLSVNNNLGFIQQEEQFSKIVASKELSNYKIVAKNDIAFNPSRINVGSIALYSEEETGIVSPMYIVFSCKETLDPYILLLMFETNRIKYLICSSLAGSVRDTLNFYALYDIRITIPQNQEKVKKVFLSIDKNILAHSQKLTLLKRQRKALMQLLLTGIVRVNVSVGE